MPGIKNSPHSSKETVMVRFNTYAVTVAACSLSLLVATSAFAGGCSRGGGYSSHHSSGHSHGGYVVGPSHSHGHVHAPVIDQFGDVMPFPGVQVQGFGELGHIHELAANARYLANHITFDMFYNYQFNPGFQPVYAKCYAFRNLAYTIHDMEHAGNFVEMSAAIQEMDSLFHSLEHDVAMWHRVHRLQIGQGDLHYKMELLEDLMHHLMRDAGLRSQFLIDSGAVTPIVPAPVVTPAATLSQPSLQILPQQLP
jgi:hypothetical protein